MSRIFLIPGLGADSRIFKNLYLDELEVIYTNSIEPGKTDTLETYAQKLIYQYHIVKQSIIIGSSLGGMIAVEIAKIIPLKKVILISSIKTINEAPWYFSLFRVLPVYKVIPGKLFASMDFLVEPIFGKMAKAEKKLFMDMLKKTSPVFLKWAMGAVLKWDNKIVPPNVYHITGDKDLVFNYKRIKDAIIVKGGTHMMVFDKANEINKILGELLEK
ncbi:MAG TPA: alpha/beta hydrolase [Mucilaginibacter sp.]|jgi:pimeloyl-ACP methyl ester carboxylesterase